MPSGTVLEVQKLLRALYFVLPGEAPLYTIASSEHRTACQLGVMEQLVLVSCLFASAEFGLVASRRVGVSKSVAYLEKTVQSS